MDHISRNWDVKEIPSTSELNSHTKITALMERVRWYGKSLFDWITQNYLLISNLTSGSTYITAKNRTTTTAAMKRTHATTMTAMSQTGSPPLSSSAATVGAAVVCGGSAGRELNCTRSCKSRILYRPTCYNRRWQIMNRSLILRRRMCFGNHWVCERSWMGSWVLFSFDG